MEQIRQKLTYANAMSSLAVFLVLGGGAALAAGLPKNSVGTRELKPNAVKTGIVARNAVRTGKLAPEAVRAGRLAKNAVTTDRLRDGAVAAAKIAGGAVTTDTIAGDTVTGAKVDESSLGQVPSAASAADAEKLGGAPAGAYQRTIRWALVSDEGVVLRQSGGISATKTSVGIYQLDFGADVSGGVLFANAVDFNETVGGAVTLLSCAFSGSPGFGSCTGGADPDVVKVVTLDKAGELKDWPFYLGVSG